MKIEFWWNQWLWPRTYVISRGLYQADSCFDIGPFTFYVPIRGTKR